MSQQGQKPLSFQIQAEDFGSAGRPTSPVYQLREHMIPFHSNGLKIFQKINEKMKLLT